MKLQAAVDRAMVPLGLTHAQYSLLASLRGMTRTGTLPSQRELADHTGLEPIFVSKLVRTLEAGGLITRSTHPADSRAMQLALTGVGSTKVDRAIEIVAELQEQFFGPIGGLQGAGTKQLTRATQRLLDEQQPDRSATRPTTDTTTPAPPHRHHHTGTTTPKEQ